MLAFFPFDIVLTSWEIAGSPAPTNETVGGSEGSFGGKRGHDQVHAGGRESFFGAKGPAGEEEGGGGRTKERGRGACEFRDVVLRVWYGMVWHGMA